MIRDGAYDELIKIEVVDDLEVFHSRDVVIVFRLVLLAWSWAEAYTVC